MKEIDKLAKKFVTKDYYETRLFMKAIHYHNPEIWKQRGATDIWFEGLKKYGHEWPHLIYNIEQRFYGKR